MSRRAAIVGVALGLFVIAGGATALVQVVTFPRLLTGIPSALGSAGEDSCFTSWAEGTLVPDLASGTAITITDHGVRTVVPVM